MAISDAQKAQLVAGFYKLLPYVSGALASRGVITAEQSTALVNGAPEFASYAAIIIGIAGGIWTGIWSWWKNRQEKRIADVAKIDGVTVSVNSQQLADKVVKADPTVTASVISP